MTRGTISYEKAFAFVVPCLLSVLIGVLSWMGVTLHEIAGSLRVVVYRLDDHDRRIQNLETLFLNSRVP